MDVLLVGGAGGIGRAVGEHLAQRGLRVFSCDIKEQSSVHENIVPIHMDITDPDQLSICQEKK